MLNLLGEASMEFWDKALSDKEDWDRDKQSEIRKFGNVKMARDLWMSWFIAFEILLWDATQIAFKFTWNSKSVANEKNC